MHPRVPFLATPVFFLIEGRILSAPILTLTPYRFRSPMPAHTSTTKQKKTLTSSTGEDEPGKIRRRRALRRQPRSAPPSRRGAAHLLPGSDERWRGWDPVCSASLRPPSARPQVRRVLRVRGHGDGGAHGGDRETIRLEVSAQSSPVRRGVHGRGNGDTIHGCTRRFTGGRHGRQRRQGISGIPASPSGDSHHIHAVLYCRLCKRLNSYSYFIGHHQFKHLFIYLS